MRVVSVPNAFAPCPLRLKLTTQLLDWSRPALGDLSHSPKTIAGPSTYLMPCGSQETIWDLGAFHVDESVP